MDTDRWRRVKTIVADALDQPARTRSAFLDAACASDAPLRREVESLLASHERAADFIERPAPIPLEALDLARTAEIAAGAQVGPYRLIRSLGSGGMGTVYLAERADEAFDKRVAIKFVGNALAHPHMVDRFLTERRILATLDHPNITRLLDAGATADGNPYVVMEYVEGEPIDVFGRRLPLRARLELFRSLCAAVHYAHQRLIVHRDIKAGNILVDAEGRPKLLDFGIAKLLEADSGLGERTLSVARALTPESASPEQLKDEPITVASDVYSLGVLLYRLLTDRKPFGGAMMTNTELTRAICEVDPPAPSRVARVDRELDWITMMALRKEPARRYGSAQQFGEDIGRYLGGRPVLAAPDTWTYRTRKFVVRRWVGVAAAAAVFVALAAGAAATYYQARRAERRFDDVRRMANTMMFEIHDTIESLPGSTAARKLVIDRARQYLDSLAADTGDDDALIEELATAY